mmetsp:Transcript_99415/g.281507  ORF Transcript_99415/g.281507 Transcript_99415/m.281507 type:complete len:226 (+) Transcript_99415:447-1124(+)
MCTCGSGRPAGGSRSSALATAMPPGTTPPCGGTAAMTRRWSRVTWKGYGVPLVHLVHTRTMSLSTAACRVARRVRTTCPSSRPDTSSPPSCRSSDAVTRAFPAPSGLLNDVRGRKQHEWVLRAGADARDGVAAPAAAGGPLLPAGDWCLLPGALVMLKGPLGGAGAGGRGCTASGSSPYSSAQAPLAAAPMAPMARSVPSTSAPPRRAGHAGRRARMPRSRFVQK